MRFRRNNYPYVLTLVVVLLAGAAGCNSGEPQTAYDRAREAQENLKQAREQAAAIVSEAEGDAVQTVQEAREQAREDVASAKEEAAEMVRAAEADLRTTMSALGDEPLTGAADEKPAVVPEKRVQVKVVTEPAAETTAQP